jgi:hypothetical protein
MLVLAVVLEAPFLPVELPDPVHLAVHPLTLVDLAVEPGVLPEAIELIVFELASVVFRVFGLPRVLHDEVRVKMKGCGFRLRGSFPGEALKGFSNRGLKFGSTEFDEVSD